MGVNLSQYTCSICNRSNRAFYFKLGICKSCYQIEYRRKNPKKTKLYAQKSELKRKGKRTNYYYNRNRSLHGRFIQASYFANRRKLIWEISFIDFQQLLKYPCFYCHAALNQTGCGLDRIDNLKGYEINNVVPCCQWCNVMKNNYSQEEFFNKIKKIVRIAQCRLILNEVNSNFNTNSIQ